MTERTTCYSSVVHALNDKNLPKGVLFCTGGIDDFVYYRKDSDTSVTHIPDLSAYLLELFEADTKLYTVPFEPTENQWDGLARDIVRWMDMEPKTPRALFKHLEKIGTEIPQWLRDEPDMKNLDKVPPKGTRAVIIYKAMLEGYTKGGDSDEEDT